MMNNVVWAMTARVFEVEADTGIRYRCRARLARRGKICVCLCADCPGLPAPLTLAAGGGRRTGEGGAAAVGRRWTWRRTTRR